MFRRWFACTVLRSLECSLVYVAHLRWLASLARLNDSSWGLLRSTSRSVFMWLSLLL